MGSLKRRNWAVDVELRESRDVAAERSLIFADGFWRRLAPVGNMHNCLNLCRIPDPDARENVVAGSSSQHVRRILGAAAIWTVLSLVLPPIASAQDAPPDSTNPTAVAADLFQFAPESLSELIEAARITQKLDRTEDAKAFLKQILDSQPGETELRALRQEIGIGPLLDLRRDPRLFPQAEQLLSAVNSASHSVTYSPQELQEFVQALGARDSASDNAISALVASGDDAIPVLLAADLKSPAGKVANEILMAHARDLRSGLLKLLDSSDASTRVRILQLLSGTADPTLAIRLLRWQFDPQGDENVSTAARDAISRLSHAQLEAGTASEAAEILIEEAETLIHNAGVRFSSLDQPASLQSLIPANHRSDALANAKVMLTDALIADPENAGAKNLMLVSNCAGTDPSIAVKATAAAGVTSEELLLGLVTALDLPSPVAAVEFLRALRDVDPSQTDLDEIGIALRQAVRSPDARVRHLASGIVRRQFPVEVSATTISQSVTSARNGSVKPEVVIISPDVRQSRSMEAVLRKAGFAPQTAPTGPKGFELAVSQMNCELILLNAESPHWPLATTLANLRADVRTQNTPIVVFGTIRFATRTLALAETYPGVWFILEPVGQVSLRSRLTSSGNPPVVSVEVADISSLRSKLNVLNLPPNVLTEEDRAELKRLAD